MKQLSFRYLHVRQAKTGMLDSFFEAYAPYEAQGMAFFDWVDTIYDPQALHDEFMARPWAEKLVDGIYGANKSLHARLLSPKCLSAIPRWQEIA